MRATRQRDAGQVERYAIDCGRAARGGRRYLRQAGDALPELLQGQPPDELLVGGHAFAAAVADERDEPPQQRREAGLEADHGHEVHDEPQHPGREARQAQPTDARDGLELADRGHAALVLVAEHAEAGDDHADRE